MVTHNDTLLSRDRNELDFRVRLYDAVKNEVPQSILKAYLEYVRVGIKHGYFDISPMFLNSINDLIMHTDDYPLEISERPYDLVANFSGRNPNNGYTNISMTHLSLIINMTCEGLKGRDNSWSFGYTFGDEGLQIYNSYTDLVKL